MTRHSNEQVWHLKVVATEQSPSPSGRHAWIAVCLCDGAAVDVAPSEDAVRVAMNHLFDESPGLVACVRFQNAVLLIADGDECGKW